MFRNNNRWLVRSPILRRLPIEVATCCKVPAFYTHTFGCMLTLPQYTLPEELDFYWLVNKFQNTHDWHGYRFAPLDLLKDTISIIPANQDLRKGFHQLTLKSRERWNNFVSDKCSCIKITCEILWVVWIYPVTPRTDGAGKKVPSPPCFHQRKIFIPIKRGIQKLPSGLVMNMKFEQLGWPFTYPFRKAYLQGRTVKLREVHNQFWNILFLSNPRHAMYGIFTYIH